MATITEIGSDGIVADQSGPLSSVESLQKEVERLRIEVGIASQSIDSSNGALELAQALPPEAIARGFTSPDDFVVKQRTFNYQDGSSYKGEALGNLRHGKGVFTLTNGLVYEGDWRYDVLDGTGKVTKPNGESYEGQWKEGKAHGNGTAQYHNGSVYIGEFKNDVRSGWGTQYFTTGDKYEGEWQLDEIQGQGQWTSADGSYYQGEWSHGSKTTGKEVSSDGIEEYSGEWKQGLRHGQGVLYIKSRSTYQGEFYQGKRHGQGRISYADGSEYTGEFKNDVRSGRGTLIVSNGSRYDGFWLDNVQHGQGMCREDTGNRYIGEYSGGKRCGTGKCIYADGGIYEGEWLDNKRHGVGIMKYANTDVYKGQWKNDKRHGRGTCRFSSSSDGGKFTGEWEDDGWVQSTAEPSKCRVAGPGVSRAIAGKAGVVLIQARDEDGNKRLSGGDEFCVELVSSIITDKVVATVTDNGDGTYQAEYTATVAGVYQLHITTLDEEHVADSPYPLRVSPAQPQSKYSQVLGPGRSKALVDQPACFEIIAHDEYGNRYFGDDLDTVLPLEVVLQGYDQLEYVVEKVAERDGRYMCSYTVPLAGYYRLHIIGGGNKKPLPGTPYSILASDTDTNDNEDVKDGISTPVLDTEHPTSTTKSDDGSFSTTNNTRIRDEAQIWKAIAAAAYAADGTMDGWDSDEDSKAKAAANNPEDEYIKAHPDVPVVENLEDIWMVSKLQRERKVKEERAKEQKLREVQEKLKEEYGAPVIPSQEEAQAALKEILEEERRHRVAAAAAAAEEEASIACTSQNIKHQQKKKPATVDELKAMAAVLDDFA